MESSKEGYCKHINEIEILESLLSIEKLKAIDFSKLSSAPQLCLHCNPLEFFQKEGNHLVE